jgi:hypothetical protein
VFRVGLGDVKELNVGGVTRHVVPGAKQYRALIVSANGGAQGQMMAYIMAQKWYNLLLQGAMCHWTMLNCPFGMQSANKFIVHRFLT